MTPTSILSVPANVLTQVERECFFEQGYLLLDDFLPADTLARLKATTEQQIDSARAVCESDEAFDLGDGHCAVKPNVRRIRAVVDRDLFYWQLACDPVLTDLVADLVGPDVKFHSGKLNYKTAGAGNAVKWHQDIQAWPHTCFSVLTIGVYLEDVGPEQGPLAVLPGSHRGALYEQRRDGEWTGHLSDDDLAAFDLRNAVELTASAGSVMAIDCCVVHGSRPNYSPRSRPLLLYVYSSADAFAYTAAPTPTRHTGELVRGAAAAQAHLDPRPCPLPPDWTRVGYRSIYAAQAANADPAAER